MWIKSSNRKELIEILVQNGMTLSCRYSDSISIEPIVGDDLYLIWDIDPRKRKCLPTVIIVAEDRLGDFLAWTSTYFPSYRPFTAYFRVLDFKTAIEFKPIIDTPSFDGLETACIGIILGEALTLYEDARRSSISPAACSRTNSYFLARAVAFGSTTKEIDKICEKWLLARKLTEQSGRNLETSQIKSIWKLITILKNRVNENLQIDGISNNLVEACFQIKNNGQITNDLWNLLTGDIRELKNAQLEMTAQREDRVRLFQRLLSIETYPLLNGNNSQSFIYGYLASLIGPGSMSHIDLISPNISKMRDVLLWYGLCAGLQKKNEILDLFNVLGRRLLRELLEPESLFNRPSADISISELQILLMSNSKGIEFRTFSPQHIVVELMPCVSTYLAWPKREVTQQKELFPKQPLLLKLRSLIAEALEIEKLLSDSRDITENKSVYKRTDKKEKKITSK
jgi:hypothetical protein